MKHFGKPAASIGFALEVDNLLLALSSQKLISEKEEKPEESNTSHRTVQKPLKRHRNFVQRADVWHYV